MHDHPDRNQLPLHSPEETANRNIARLLQRADHPARPSELAMRRWRDQMRRELPAVVHRAHRRERRAFLAPLAAAALLGLGLWFVLAVDRAGTSWPIVAQTGKIELRTGDGPWHDLGAKGALARGDAVRLTDGSARLELDDGSRFDLDHGVLERDRDGLRLSSGSGEWNAASQRRASIATPLLELFATDARVRLRVREMDPLPREGTEMDRRKLAAIGGGLAVLITVVVLSTGDDPVEVVRDGETVALDEGDTATAGPGSGVAVTRGGSSVASGAHRAQEPSTDEDPVAETPLAGATREVQITLVDPDGTPIPMATLECTQPPETDLAELAAPALSLEDGSDDATIRRGSADADGRVTIRIPEAWERVVVSASAERYQEVLWTSPEAAGDGDPVAEGESIAEGELGPWTITLPFETSIVGHVIDGASGDLVAGALVGIQKDVGAQRYSDPVIRTFDEEDGSFYFGGLSPGRYWVWAYREGSVRSETITVAVAAAERVTAGDLPLTPGAAVRVVVFEERSGAPVAGACAYPHLDHLPGTVDFIHRGKSIDERVRNAGRTGADGIALLADLPLRRTLIRVLHPGYRPVDTWVEPDQDQQIEIRVPVSTGPSIRGDVIDENGERVEGSQVIAVSMTLDNKMAELSIAPVVGGAYEIENVNPGMYVVLHSTFEDDAGPFKMKFENVPADRDAIVDFVELASLATLRGHVRDTSGAPLTQAFVTVSSQNDREEVTFESSSTDAEGWFEIRNLAFRQWNVAVSKEPQSMVTIGVVELTQAIDYEQEFTIPDGAVEGIARSEDGSPAIDVELFLFSVLPEEGETEWRGRTETDSEGHFSFKGLSPGRFRLFMQGIGYRQAFSRDFTVQGDETVSHDVTVQVSGTVRVIVTDATGLPATDIGVVIRDSEGEARNLGLPVRTSAEGVYVFPSLGPGDYRVQLRRDGEELGVERMFTARMGETVEVRMTLP